jgi:glycosyltransferase involved in cell wall biosynthesis
MPLLEQDRLTSPTVADAPLLSIVVPCLNEELTIGEFVDWCREGLEDAGITGEILIVDSSTDRSPEIAAEHGAVALRVPKRGLGRAYIDAIPHVRGRYVLMGDCDLTYDFRQLRPFVEALEGGAEFVMGSRFRGYIEPQAMPALHRYFGTPLTTWILNRIYGTDYSDIHCGMRAIRLDALQRIGLQSQGWEYASEMVIKAATLGLATAEVPVRFYKDREGRESHHKRMGWTSPWLAGWDNLKAMMMYAPHAFLTRPGAVLALLGILIAALLASGPIRLLGVGLDLHWMLAGLTFATAGYSVVQLGVLAELRHHVERRGARRVAGLLTWRRGSAITALLIVAGLACTVPLLVEWLSNDLRLHDMGYLSIFGLMLIVLGFQTFCFTLLLQILPAPERAAQPTIPESADVD